MCSGFVDCPAAGQFRRLPLTFDLLLCHASCYHHISSSQAASLYLSCMEIVNGLMRMCVSQNVLRIRCSSAGEYCVLHQMRSIYIVNIQPENKDQCPRLQTYDCKTIYFRLISVGSNDKHYKHFISWSLKDRK